jgi:hypothetical protein
MAAASGALPFPESVPPSHLRDEIEGGRTNVVAALKTQKDLPILRQQLQRQLAAELAAARASSDARPAPAFTSDHKARSYVEVEASGAKERGGRAKLTHAMSLPAKRAAVGASSSSNSENPTHRSGAASQRAGGRLVSHARWPAPSAAQARSTTSGQASHRSGKRAVKSKSGGAPAAEPAAAAAAAVEEAVTKDERSWLQRALDTVETVTGLDLDGDGTIGGVPINPSTV